MTNPKTKAAENITAILTACGCKPTTTTNKNGDTIIKVNAPETLPNFNDPLTAFLEMD